MAARCCKWAYKAKLQGNKEGHVGGVDMRGRHKLGTKSERTAILQTAVYMRRIHSRDVMSQMGLSFDAIAMATANGLDSEHLLDHFGASTLHQVGTNANKSVAMMVKIKHLTDTAPCA